MNQRNERHLFTTIGSTSGEKTSATQKSSHRRFPCSCSYSSASSKSFGFLLAEKYTCSASPLITQTRRQYSEGFSVKSVYRYIVILLDECPPVILAQDSLFICCGSKFFISALKVFISRPIPHSAFYDNVLTSSTCIITGVLPLWSAKVMLQASSLQKSKDHC